MICFFDVVYLYNKKSIYVATTTIAAGGRASNLFSRAEYISLSDG